MLDELGLDKVDRAVLSALCDLFGVPLAALGDVVDNAGQFGTARADLLDEPSRGIDIGAKVEIYKLLNSLVERGVTGELLVRGHGVMRGYLDDPAATSALIMGLSDETGQEIGGQIHPFDDRHEQTQQTRGGDRDSAPIERRRIRRARLG